MPRGVPNKPAQVPGTTAAPVTEDGQPEITVEAPAPAPASLAGLPHPDDIDPKTLKTSVMTTHGWLCADESDKPRTR